MKAKECTLVVNTANGYCLAPEKCRSIADAVAKGRESCGFAFRIYVGKVLVRRGFCN